VREVFELSRILKELLREFSEITNEDIVNIEESSSDVIEISCDIEINSIDSISKLDYNFWGVDASIKQAKFTGIDIYICSGALIGEEILTIPGIIDARWLGIRLRYSVSEKMKEFLEKISEKFYIKSRFTNSFFDGSFSEDVARDEIRLSIENELIRYWNGDDNEFLLVDGPIFPLPIIVTKIGTRYSDIYLGLIKERIEIIRNKNRGSIVSVVKRLSKSKYLASCLDVNVTDELVAIRLAHDRAHDSIFIGPLRISLRLDTISYSKWIGYIVKRIGNTRHVLRIEALEKDVLFEISPYINTLIDHNGIPKPIILADKICKKLASSAYILVWGLSPVDPTYEGLEGLYEAAREIQD